MTFADEVWKEEGPAGYLICCADAEWLAGHDGPLSLVSRHSGRCRGIARSAPSVEVQAAGEVQEEGEFIRLALVNFLFEDVKNSDAGVRIALLPRALVFDCEDLCDGVSRSETSVLRLPDKGSAIEAMPFQSDFPSETLIGAR